jgi:uncharacterized membrane protein YdbT with pleckstrin-like domain
VSIKLRQDEQIQCEAHLHWSSYIAPGAWAFVMGLSMIGQIFSKELSSTSAVWTAVMGAFPLIYVWLRNKNKSYVVTNQRLYVEEGILAKSKTDIPFNKINDINCGQGLLQRLFGAGNVSVMTGNDKPTKLKNLDQPEQFREALSNVCNKKAA